jgi:hypothetical protein
MPYKIKWLPEFHEGFRVGTDSQRPFCRPVKGVFPDSWISLSDRLPLQSG